MDLLSQSSSPDESSDGGAPGLNVSGGFQKITPEYREQLDSFLSEQWTLRFKEDWAVIFERATILRDDQAFQSLDMERKGALLVSGAGAALKLGKQDEAAEFIKRLEELRGSNPSTGFDHDLQRLNGALHGKIQFTPEQVLDAAPSAASSFGWLKATNVPPAISDLTQRIITLCKDTGADSAVVIWGDKVVPFKAGSTSPATEETVYYAPQCAEKVPMMSSTKSIGGLVAFMLKDRGALNLDDPVHTLMPEWGWQNDSRRDITVRHLLTHTSGLPGNSYFNAPDNQDSNGEMKDKPFKNSVDFIAGGIQHQQVHPLGCFDYSNVGSQLLAGILNKAIEEHFPRYKGGPGQALNNFINAEIFKPLGMERSEMTFDGAGTVRIFADMLSTSLDFARVGVMLKNGGMWKGRQIIKEASILEMLGSPPNLQAAADNYCGHLWWRGMEGHAFMSRGYLDTSMFIVPALDLVVVRTQEISPNPYFESKLASLLGKFVEGNATPLRPTRFDLTLRP